MLVPDLAGWRRERLPLIPDGNIDVVLDWVCEILSPDTACKDRTRKLPLYGELGVAHAWLVDPAAKTIEVLRFADEHASCLGPGVTTIRCAPSRSTPCRSIWRRCGRGGRDFPLLWCFLIRLN